MTSMQSSNKYTFPAKIVSNLAAGILTNMLCTLLGCCILAKLIELYHLQPEKAEYGCLAALISSSFIGAWACNHKQKENVILLCCLSGLLYWAALLILNTVSFGGQYTNVAQCLLAVLSGSILYAVCQKVRPHHKRRSNFKR